MGQEHRSEASRAWVRGLGCRCCSAYVVEQANHATTYTYLSLTTAVVLRAPFRSVCWGPRLAHKTAHLHRRSFKLFQRNSWRARGIGDHREYVRYSTHRRIFLREASRPSCSPWFFVSLPATPYTVDGSLSFLSLSRSSLPLASAVFRLATTTTTLPRRKTANSDTAPPICFSFSCDWHRFMCASRKASVAIFAAGMIFGSCISSPVSANFRLYR